MRVAIVSNGMVTNIFEIDNPDDYPDMTMIDITDQPTVAVGDNYDAVTGIFSPPGPPTPTREEHNQPILNQLLVLDMKAIRPLRDGEQDRVDALAAQAAVLRATLWP